MPPIDDNPLDTLPEAPISDPAPEKFGGNITIEQAIQLVQESQAPLAEELRITRENQTQQNKRFEELTQTMTQGHNQLIRNSTPPVEEQDFLTELTTGNAEQAIGRIVEQRLAALTPVLSNIVQSGSSTFVELEANSIDNRFGTGAWDKFFSNPVNQIMSNLAKTNPAAMMDRTIIGHEVNGLVGKQVDELVAYRDEFKKTKTATETTDQDTLVNSITSAVINRTNGIGGMRHLDATGSIAITPEVEGYIAERMRATGQKINPKEWVKETDFGNDIDSYRESRKTISNGAA